MLKIKSLKGFNEKSDIKKPIYPNKHKIDAI